MSRGTFFTEQTQGTANQQHCSEPFLYIFEGKQTLHIIHLLIAYRVAMTTDD